MGCEESHLASNKQRKPWLDSHLEDVVNIGFDAQRLSLFGSETAQNNDQDTTQDESTVIDDTVSRAEACRQAFHLPAQAGICFRKRGHTPTSASTEDKYRCD